MGGWEMPMVSGVLLILQLEMHYVGLRSRLFVQQVDELHPIRDSTLAVDVLDVRLNGAL